MSVQRAKRMKDNRRSLDHSITDHTDHRVNVTDVNNMMDVTDVIDVAVDKSLYGH